MLIPAHSPHWLETLARWYVQGQGPSLPLITSQWARRDRPGREGLDQRG